MLLKVQLQPFWALQLYFHNKAVPSGAIPPKLIHWGIDKACTCEVALFQNKAAEPRWVAASLEGIMGQAC